MAITKQVIEEHDAIELLDPVGRWPAGRIGAVVGDYGAVKLIEIANDRGVMLDLIQVSEDRVRLIAKHGN